MMDETAFWDIIDSSRLRAAETPRRKTQDFIDVHEKTLAGALRVLPVSAVVEFDERFWERHAHAYRWDLWAVAYWLCGGCSDDGFIDFRSCLISLGRESYYAALADPESLADVVDGPDAPYIQAEGFQYVAFKVYKELTGSDEWPVALVSSPHREPDGERFDFDDEDEMERRFPRIVEKFPDGLD